MVILNLKLFNRSYYLFWKFSVGISQKTFPVVMLGLSRWWQLKYFLNFHPDPWGFMIQFDLRIFFKWVGSTTN